MPNFADGTYIIKNCLHLNLATLANDNDNEPVCGVSVAEKAAFRDTEKVRGCNCPMTSNS